LGETIITVKKEKTNFSFNEFLSSLAGEPLEIKYKDMAKFFHVSQSTLSKLGHNRLRKMPVGMHPDVMAKSFADGVVGSFPPSCGTVRHFVAYARMLCERYLCSEALNESAALLANVGPIDDAKAKKLYTGAIPKLIMRCYEEAYANTELGYSDGLVSRSEVQHEICYQRICDMINRDIFDGEKLKQLLNVVYAANIRRQITAFTENPAFLQITERFIHNQIDKPFYNSIRRTEVISISEDSSEITRKIKEQKRIVLQVLEPQKLVFKQSLNHFVDLPPDEIINHMVQDFTCTVNHIPLVQYINMHENTNYTSVKQFLSVEPAHNIIDDTVTTELVFQFNLYPSTAGEAISMIDEYTLKTPFIRNVSCNYSYSLFYPCKFFEHEFILDAKTRTKWGVRVKLFTPMTTSSYYGEDSENPHFHNNGTSASKRITFYDWALPGTGYYRNLYELQYANGERK